MTRLTTISIGVVPLGSCGPYLTTRSSSSTTSCPGFTCRSRVLLEVDHPCLRASALMALIEVSREHVANRVFDDQDSKMPVRPSSRCRRTAGRPPRARRTAVEVLDLVRRQVRLLEELGLACTVLALLGRGRAPAAAPSTALSAERS